MTHVISFYTDDWEYPRYAKALKNDCERLKIPNKIELLPSTGSYLKNTCLKPQFILDKLNELKSPVLWVDCDGTILDVPIFSKSFDFAARKKPLGNNRTWHVGTMWFNYTPSMLDFIEEWIKNTGNLSDESALEETWKNHGYLIDAVEVPESYFILLKRGEEPYGIISHRISSSDSKRREMLTAVRKNKAGIY